METVKRFQPGHGEWTDEMAPVSARQFQDSPVNPEFSQVISHSDGACVAPQCSAAQ